MKKLIRKIKIHSKGFILWLRPGVMFGFLSKPLQFAANVLTLSHWTSEFKGKGLMNDFYSAKRDHDRRFNLYKAVISHEGLESIPIDYIEFGVSQGHSFKWWIAANQHADSRFYGFDTFEGLPENWGGFKQGEMSARIPSIDDIRHSFIKGLFQETLFPFLDSHEMNSAKRKIIHCDADLFSSTLFVLASFAKYLRAGDIIFFDEFNVPNHEYYAFKIFCEAFYLEFEFLGAVNNYFEVAFKVK